MEAQDIQSSDYPKVSPAYVREEALTDIPAIKYAERLFLDSKMFEAERYCLSIDPNRERLYITSGYSLIRCLKALMSHEDQDLQEALAEVNHGNVLAHQHRAPSPSLTSRVLGLLVENKSSGAAYIKSMSPVQRHAELLYAETLCAKALVKIISSGSWMAFIKEALNFRTMINVYMQLGEYIGTMDKEASARGEGPEDPSIDKDFRSGVELGLGASNLILSFLPDKAIAIAEVFGYKGDRAEGLRLLTKAGGWSKATSEPAVLADQEGLRRPLADIALIVFHLLLSSFTYKGVDIGMAERVLEWNLKRFPNGVFFLFGEGRLRLIQSQPSLAIESYQKAISVQSQYLRLQYVSLWEMAICNFALWDIQVAFQCWKKLADEATWSKACYYYGAAVCLLELGGKENVEKASEFLDRVPGALNRIVGKSIPIEKFVARKARKFHSQARRLVLPAVEFSYMFLSISHAPRDILITRILPTVRRSLDSITPFMDKENEYFEGQGFWDDICLARFLDGVCLRYIVYPDPHTKGPDKISVETPTDITASRALEAFEFVIRHGSKIELDHYILYHAHYELGRLQGCLGNKNEAREHLELIAAGTSLEKRRKGKYSMQSALMMRANAALEQLNGDVEENPCEAQSIET